MRMLRVADPRSGNLQRREEDRHSPILPRPIRAAVYASWLGLVINFGERLFKNGILRVVNGLAEDPE